MDQLQELIGDLKGALEGNTNDTDEGVDPILDLYREARHNMSWCLSRSRKKSAPLIDNLAVLEELYDARHRLEARDPRHEVLSTWIDKLEPDATRLRWAVELKRIIEVSEAERSHLEANDRRIPRALSTLVRTLRGLQTRRRKSFTRHLPLPDKTLERFHEVVDPLTEQRLREVEHYRRAWAALEELCE